MMKKLIKNGLTLAAGLAVAFLLAVGPSQAADPGKLRIAVILASGPDNPWDRGLLNALNRVAEEKPHGLDITYQATDPVWGDDALKAMTLFAESGQYDIVWGHSTYSDQVKQIQAEFPDILFVVSGSGNEGLGGNQYWVYKRLHEPAYLLGILAGELTQSNVLGVVGTYPADDVNDEINAFFEGARTVNPGIIQKVAFIESWYDPGKAAEYSGAQISAGADIIFQLGSNFETCKQTGIICFGNFEDENHLAPEVILSSAVADWSPDVRWIVDEWWAHMTKGESYKGNQDNTHWFSMADGGADIAPFHGLDGKVPADIKAKVDAARRKIIDGSLVVEVDVSAPVTQ